MNRIRQLREENKMTQSQLADVINSNYQTISDYEREKYYPSIEVLKELAGYFKTSIDYLIGFSDVRDPYMSAREQYLTPIEMELVQNYRELDIKAKEKLISISLGMKEAQKQ